jgi:hypothetical protein
MKTEPRIVLRALRAHFTGSALVDTVDATSDWGRTARWAETEGVAPLICAKIEELPPHPPIPSDVITTLRSVRQVCARNNLRWAGELRAIVTAFAIEGIGVVLLKGLALADEVYGNLALRPSGDIDVLVPETDLGKAEAILMRRGYAPVETWHSTAWYRAHHHHLAPLKNNQSGMTVEIHRHIVPPRWTKRLPVADLHARARTASIAGTRVGVLCPEDMILHLAMHLVENVCAVGRARLLLLCDVAQTVKRFGKELSWPSVLKTAASYDVRWQVWLALSAARTLLGADIPPLVLRELRSGLPASLTRAALLEVIVRDALLDAGVEHRFVPAWFRGLACEKLLDDTTAGHGLTVIPRLIAAHVVHRARAIFTSNSQSFSPTR